MIKLVIRFALLALLAAGFAWLADHPGTLTVNWLGYRIEDLPVALVLVGLAILIMLLVFIWALVTWVLGTPGAIGDFFRLRRRKRGLEAISRGLVAVGAGDLKDAQKYALQASRLTGDDALAKLLEAQTARLAGDTVRVKHIYDDMLRRPETELVALRGLFTEARKVGEHEAAREYAARAYRNNPAVEWASQAMETYLSADGDWPAVAKVIEEQRRSGAIDREEATRRRAVVLTAQAVAAEDTDPEAALDLATKAHRLDPALAPAAVTAGRIQAHKGSLRKASRLLEQAWKAAPHPDIADVYAHARAGDSPQDRLKRVRSLVSMSPGGEEGAIALAVAAIEAHDWKLARETLKPVVVERPSSRVCSLMAEIEEAEFGDKGRTREWLARAVRAPRDPAWTADGIVSQNWLPISPVSGRLGAFEWKMPVAGIGFAEEGDLEEPAGPEGHVDEDVIDLTAGEDVASDEVAVSETLSSDPAEETGTQAEETEPQAEEPAVVEEPEAEEEPAVEAKPDDPADAPDAAAEEEPVAAEEPLEEIKEAEDAPKSDEASSAGSEPQVAEDEGEAMPEVSNGGKPAVKAQNDAPPVVARQPDDPGPADGEPAPARKGWFG